MLIKIFMQIISTQSYRCIFISGTSHNAEFAQNCRANHPDSNTRIPSFGQYRFRVRNNVFGRNNETRTKPRHKTRRNGPLCIYYPARRIVRQLGLEGYGVIGVLYFEGTSLPRCNRLAEVMPDQNVDSAFRFFLDGVAESARVKPLFAHPPTIPYCRGGTIVEALPIRLTPMTATCRVPPLSRVKLGIGWSRGVARDAEQ